MVKETGYSLTRRFFDFAFENSRLVRPVHVALYCWCIEKNNRLGWLDEFQLPTNEGMQAIGLKDKVAFLTAIKDLSAWGAIRILQESKNIYTARYISLKGCSLHSNGSLNGCIYNEEIPYATPIGTPNAIPNATPITTPTNNKLQTTNYKLQTVDFTFQEFWDLYAKKEGDKKGCERKWNKLSKDCRRKIIETLPSFKNKFSNIQFQPYPATYLNQERWNDEIAITKPINSNSPMGISVPMTDEEYEEYVRPTKPRQV